MLISMNNLDVFKELVETIYGPVEFTEVNKNDEILRFMAGDVFFALMKSSPQFGRLISYDARKLKELQDEWQSLTRSSSDDIIDSEDDSNDADQDS